MINKKFLVGDIVKCVDDGDLEDPSPIVDGNTYEVIDVDHGDILIFDENENEEWYFGRRFVLYKRMQPVTENDFLDCFKRNFADGGI